MMEWFEDLDRELDERELRRCLGGAGVSTREAEHAGLRTPRLGSLAVE